MTTAIMSKRTQMRNERALQDLVKLVPGNDRCADCEARNPGWASWSVRRHLISRSSLGAISPSPVANVNPLAGHISVHAMRLPPPQAGYPHIKGQILEHG
ncbi:MAG: hypothetical protein Q9180_001473 [Flavoplaca navasiana]